MRISIILVALLALMSNNVNAQCKGFAKKKCMPQLSPFTHDGKMNLAQVWPGDKADLMMTFYANTPYRVVVCSTSPLPVDYKVKDLDGNVILESNTNEKPFIEFKVQATQKLVVEVTVRKPAKKLNDMAYQECLGVFVGLK
jgi:hypothetical protein